MAYDGHGRLKTQHLPRYEANKVTTFGYDDDDTVRSVTDPRGVVMTYGFTNSADITNKRHLVNSVTYSNAPAGVPVPAQVRFEYDAAGNRTSMTDEAGSVSYQFDTLSRLTSETRQFNGITHRTYPLTYGYNLAGQLKSITDPFNHTTTYHRDEVGQVTGVTGSGYPAIPQLAGGVQFASGLKYRAWGAVREASYGDGRGMTADYDTRLRVTGFHMPGPLTLDKAYQYEADGALRFADDLVDDTFDRSYSYDHGGRLAAAHTGAQARGGTADDGPYQQTYTHDPFGHVTGQTNVLWKQPVGGGGGTYQNDRRQGWNYDAAGNLTYDQLRHYVNDAAGRMRSFDSGVQTYAYDGEGQVARVTRQLEGTFTVYNLRSTALGGAVVSQLKPQPNAPDVRDDIVHAGGAEVRREVWVTGERVAWAHEDPAGTTVQEGGLTSFGGPNANFYSPIVQLDAVRASVGTFDPAEVEEPPPPPDETSPEGPVYNNPLRPGTVCVNNWMMVDCPDLLRIVGQRTGRRVREVQWGWLRDSDVFIPFNSSSGAVHEEAGDVVSINEDNARFASYTWGPSQVTSSFVGGGVAGTAAVVEQPQKNSFIDSNADCHIEVNFEGRLSPGTPKFEMGPDRTKLGPYTGMISGINATFYSFRFEVRGWVNSGEIGRVGGPDDDKPVLIKGGGEWTIGQEVWRNVFMNGKPDSLNNTTRDDSPDYSYSIRGRNFAWYDYPGFNTFSGPVHTGKWVTNFTAYAQAGKKRCAVQFHIVGIFLHGGWEPRIGRGHVGN